VGPYNIISLASHNKGIKLRVFYGLAGYFILDMALDGTGVEWPPLISPKKRKGKLKVIGHDPRFLPSFNPLAKRSPQGLIIRL